ncbi:MAG: metallophosphoesterase, partial [Candidatus Hermodarchaeia archaeon]
YDQYSLASDLIEQIPEYIEVVIIPGNHDATRQALPQPAIFKKYANPIYNLTNVTMLGDPAQIRLHGVNLLIHHGRGLDDVISRVPDVTYKTLKDEIPLAMEYLLKTRHLAPIYGSKTPIAPALTDDLVITSPPDIFHTGHVHVMNYKKYRGTLMINSGTWQAQTDFQERMGLTPTPGVIPVVDLQTFKVTPVKFVI